ncbi:MAG TPA: hypothetical protein VIF11_05740 [Methylomirabilota bacterium]|jgi:hypothetical protein
MATPEITGELTMLASSLYREEVFTDHKVGVIRVLTPVTADGMMDVTRKVLYTGEAQMLTAAGVLPLAFEIDAGSLSEAVANFGSCAKAAVERALEELQELRRQASSSLVVTDRMPGGAPGRPGLIRP